MELVAMDESSIVAEPFGAIVMKDRQCDRDVPDCASIDESDRSEAFRKTDNLLDQIIASEMGPRWRRGEFTGRSTMEPWDRLEP